MTDSAARCVCGRFAAWQYLVRNYSWPVGVDAPIPLTSSTYAPLVIKRFAACRDHKLDRRARARAV